jgi:glycosyltransferase involved in cell wall biosynthesis
MRIAFYAPLKPPDHPVPFGDRRMGGLLIEALRLAGHEVQLASRLRTRDSDGDPERQRRLAAIGEKLAQRYLRCTKPPPDLWFTYHLYDKAPDHLGPRVAAALGIPYVVAKASIAPSSDDGTWADGYQSVTAAVRGAAAVIGFNDADTAGVLPCLGDGRRYHCLPPFLDVSPYTAARRGSAERRAVVASACGIDTTQPLLVALAMIRPDTKLASYRALAQALEPLLDKRWQLLVIGGDSTGRVEISAALASLGRKAFFVGSMEESAVPDLLGAADLMIWPAIDEAYGVPLLEAQAAGVPIIAGRNAGTEGIVTDGVTGLLAPRGDAAALTGRIAFLLDNPNRRMLFGEAAQRHVAARFDLPSAATRLSLILRQAASAL